MTEIKCAKNESIYTFDANTSIVNTNNLQITLPQAPTQIQSDFTLGVNLFPVCQSKYVRATCVNNLGVISNCTFPNAIQIKKTGIYGVKFQAEVSSSTLTTPQIVLAGLMINGLLDNNSLYLNIIYTNEQIVNVNVELGIELKRGDIIQLVVTSLGSDLTNLQISKSKLSFINLEKCSKSYSEFNTTFALTQKEQIAVPFKEIIGNCYVKVSNTNSNFLKFKEAGHYKFHFYWNALVTRGIETASFYPFQILIMANDEIIAQHNGYLLPDTQTNSVFFNTGNLFFSSYIPDSAKLAITITSPAAILYGLNVGNSLLEIIQIDKSTPHTSQLLSEESC